MMRPNDVSVALSNLNGGFNAFTKQVTLRSMTVECLKEKTNVETKFVKLMQMQELILQKKVKVIRSLTSLLGSETLRVEELQKKIVDQHKSLLKMSETMRTMDQNHSEAMNTRKSFIAKFNQSYKQRLNDAIKKRWEAEQLRVRELNSTKSKLEEQLKSLKSEAEKREMELKFEEDKHQMDLIKREKRMEMEAECKIAQLRKKKTQMVQSYNNRIEKMKVQSEGRIQRLMAEVEVRNKELRDVPHSYGQTTEKPTPRKSTKRKSEDLYLDFCKDKVSDV